MTSPPPTPDPQKNSLRSSVDTKIRIRLIILLGLLAFKLYAVVMLIFRDDVHPGWLIVGIVPGIIIGIIASRMHVISWDQAKKEVVSQMDVVGIIVLVLYLLYTFFSDDLVGAGLHNVGAASLVVTSMAATVVLVRMRLTFHNVAEVLRDAGLISQR